MKGMNIVAGERILVVDDEAEIRELITKNLKREGMEIFHAEGGRKALQILQEKSIDMIILDIMMEDMDGFDVLRKIREQQSQLPVMFLSARQEDYDKVLGLGLGADDYMTKPFSPAELTARVKAHIRRSQSFNNKQEPMLTRGALCLNINDYTLTKNDAMLELSATEFKLLRFFMQQPMKVFTKAQIYRGVWEDDFYDDNSVMVYISHLREKIEDNPRDPQYIQTVRGIGYKFGVI